MLIFENTEVEKFALTAHEGQWRRGNVEPYFKHCKRVAYNVYLASNNAEAMAVAYMHDVVEDTGYSFDDCNKYLETDEAKEALVLLTKVEGMKTKEYMERLLNSGNRIALLVKFFDALDNSIFTEEGKAFTTEVLGLNVLKEHAKYKKRAMQCKEAIDKLGHDFDLDGWLEEDES